MNSDPLIGRQLGGTYQILSRIGEGGMGAVYLAAHARLSRRFAVKTLHREIAQIEEAYQRFRREAEITSKLGHPHIIEVIDFDSTDDGVPYIVMELLEGEDLDARLERVGRLSVEQTADLLHDVCSALGAAHRQGIVHRDLKPQNIFLCRHGEEDDFVKVLDFGISKIRGSTSVMTRADSFLGTPFYMAPEQAEGRSAEADARTDVFALGAILYRALTGRQAFSGNTPPAILYQIVHRDPPPVEQEAPDVPPAVAQVVHRALAKEPAQRFPSVDALSQAFDEALGLPPRSRGRRAPPSQELMAAQAVRQQVAQVQAQVAQAQAQMAQALVSTPRPGTGVAAPAAAPVDPDGPTMGPGVDAGAVPPPGPITPPAVVQRTGPGAAAPRLELVDPVGETLAPAAAEVGPTAGVGVATGGAGAPGAPTMDVRPHGPRRGRWLLAGLALLLVAGGAVALVTLRGPGRSTASPVTPAAAGQAASADAGRTAPADQWVKVQLIDLPAGAAVTIDGRLTEGNPIKIRRGDRPRTLQVVASGGKRFQTELLPTRDRVLTVRLQRSAHAQTSSPARRSSRAAPAGRAPVGSSAPPVVTPRPGPGAARAAHAVRPDARAQATPPPPKPDAAPAPRIKPTPKPTPNPQLPTEHGESPMRF